MIEDIICCFEVDVHKELFTDNPESIDVNYYHARNQIDEAEYIVRALKKIYITKDPSQLEIDLDEENYFDSNLKSDGDIDITPSDSSKGSDSVVSGMFDFYLKNESTTNAQIKSFGSFTSPASWTRDTTDWSKCKELNDSAILYRTHSQSRAIEEVFIKHRLPYKLVSGTKFLERKEIKDALAIFKYFINPADRLSFARFFPLVTQGVGPKGLEQIIAVIQNKLGVIDASVTDYIAQSPEMFYEPPKIKQKLQDQLDRVQTVLNKSIEKTNIKNPESKDSLIEWAKLLLQDIGYIDYLRTVYPIKEDMLARMENVGELYSYMLKFEESSEDITSKLNLFLTDITLMTNQDSETDDTPKISLMSLHQSKGLEYETVFLVGIEDNLLPHSNSFMEVDGIAEEVRLAYVGITRAKKHLHLISAESRINFGQIQANSVSRIFRPFLVSHTKRVF